MAESSREFAASVDAPAQQDARRYASPLSPGLPAAMDERALREADRARLPLEGSERLADAIKPTVPEAPIVALGGGLWYQGYVDSANENALWRAVSANWRSVALSRFAGKPAVLAQWRRLAGTQRELFEEARLFDAQWRSLDIDGRARRFAAMYLRSPESADRSAWFSLSDDISGFYRRYELYRRRVDRWENELVAFNQALQAAQAYAQSSRPLPPGWTPAWKPAVSPDEKVRWRDPDGNVWTWHPDAKGAHGRGGDHWDVGTPDGRQFWVDPDSGKWHPK